MQTEPAGIYLGQTDPIVISRSHLETLNRCRRKFWYRYVLEEETPGTAVMAEGTIGHAGLAAYFTARSTMDHEEAKAAALQAMADLIAAGEYEYRGKAQKLNIYPDDLPEVTTRLGDVVQRWLDYIEAEKVLSGASIVAVEKSFQLPITQAIVYDGIFDLVLLREARPHKIVEVWDHKFVFDVNQQTKFVHLDVQLNTYEVIANAAIPQMLYDQGLIERDETVQVELVYNMIRREVPPGYGHRPLTTKSGAKSTASQRPDDYARQIRLCHSAEQLGHLERTLRMDIAEAIAVTYSQYREPMRTAIKTGGDACATACPFWARCGAELVGAVMPTFAQ